MTTKELVSLEQKLLVEVPELSVKGPLMFISPVKRLLRGVGFQGSSFSKTSIYANVFIMPLCVPSNHLTITYGARVRHNGLADMWDKNMEDLTVQLGKAIRDYAMPYLDEINSSSRFIEHLKAKADTIRTKQALAMMLAQEGRINESLEYLDGIIATHDKTSPWQVELAEQAEALIMKLLSDPIEVQRHLEEVEIQTLRNLGLDSFRGE